jgi:hypothetical protein
LIRQAGGRGASGGACGRRAAGSRALSCPFGGPGGCDAALACWALFHTHTLHHIPPNGPTCSCRRCSGRSSRTSCARCGGGTPLPTCMRWGWGACSALGCARRCAAAGRRPPLCCPPASLPCKRPARPAAPSALTPAVSFGLLHTCTACPAASRTAGTDPVPLACLSVLLYRRRSTPSRP